ncbi:MAG: OmpA family protein [Thiohalocapsa sp.]
MVLIRAMSGDRGKALLVVMALSLVTVQSAVDLPLERVRDAMLEWILGPPPAEIARIKTLAGTAAVVRGNGHLPATPGTPLYQNDVIETGSDGSVGLTFIDDSVFSAGPDSEVALRQFHFDVDTAHGDMQAELHKGTLAVVSGAITHSTPGAMHIKTPTAILGVRGTTFALEVTSAAASIPRLGRCQCASEGDADPEPVRCVATANACEASCGGVERHGQSFFAAAHDVAVCGPDLRPAEERYVVLPNADGRPGSGAVTVEHGKSAETLDRPYAAAELSGGETLPATFNAAVTDELFHQALAARPLLPTHFRLHFLLDSDEMTAESRQDYPAIVADIKKRPSYQVQLIGYTDALADDAHNLRLSVSRAAAVRRALVKDGVDPNAITAEGRGTADPLVATAAGIGEPRNRRVEVTIR